MITQSFFVSTFNETWQHAAENSAQKNSIDVQFLEKTKKVFLVRWWKRERKCNLRKLWKFFNFKNTYTNYATYLVISLSLGFAIKWLKTFFRCSWERSDGWGCADSTSVNEIFCAICWNTFWWEQSATFSFDKREEKCFVFIYSWSTNPFVVIKHRKSKA